MEQFERIRREARDEGLSIRELAARHHVHRRTVRQALADAVPPTRKTPVRTAPVLGPHVDTVRAWLIEDLTAPRKQRHTARRVWQRLVEEHAVAVAESSVRPLVAALKKEVGLVHAEVMVPQHHAPGVDAQVDFGEFHALIDGVDERLWMFVMRLSHSGRAVHYVYPNQAAESFLDGHVRAFAHFGGVPTGMVRYDNLRPAVTKVLLGRERECNERFVGMRSHYGFESFFCKPGKPGAHEKGGVEGEVGRFRRRHLTPVPQVATLAQLEALMAAADVADEDRHIAGRPDTVGVTATAERAWLRALPVAGYDATQMLSVRVDAKARICVRQSYYSVPAHLVGRAVDVRLGARTVTVLQPGHSGGSGASGSGTVVAQHARSMHKYTQDLLLDHYLEVLTRKPGALAGSTPLAAARASGAFTPAHQRFWDAARRAHGDGAGTRELIEVLLGARTLPASALVTGMDAAVGVANPTAAVALVEARRAIEHATPTGSATSTTSTPGARQIEQVAAGIYGEPARPAPRLDGYDELVAAVPA